MWVSMAWDSGWMSGKEEGWVDEWKEGWMGEQVEKGMKWDEMNPVLSDISHIRH